MKKIRFLILAAIALTIIAAGCSFKERIPDHGEEGQSKDVDPEEFEAKEILWFDLESRDEEITEKTEDISIQMYPGDTNAVINGEEYALSEEQCSELRELILEYSQRVKEKEDEYWPHTEEYPDMFRLFTFDMWGEDKRYKEDGALCYPDGWEEFIGNLKGIIIGPKEEPVKRTEELRRVDPEEFKAEEIIWFDLFFYNEKTMETDEISLQMYPGDTNALINGEAYELNEEQCGKLREIVLDYGPVVKEKKDEYWPSPTEEYPAMPVLFVFKMTGMEKFYKEDGALCYPDGWEEFVGDLKRIACEKGEGKKIAGPEKSSIYRKNSPVQNRTAGLDEAAPAEFKEEEILFFSLFSYHEDMEKMEGIILFLYPGEEEADINGETVRLNEKQGNALRRLILQYSQIVEEQEDEYWPSDTDEALAMAMIFDFRMSGEEKEYKADGGLCYPDGWEEFIEDLKEIIL